MVLYINFEPNLHYCARGPVLSSFEVIQRACEKKSLGLILVVKWMVSDVQTCTCQGRRNQSVGGRGGASAPLGRLVNPISTVWADNTTCPSPPKKNFRQPDLHSCYTSSNLLLKFSALFEIFAIPHIPQCVQYGIQFAYILPKIKKKNAQTGRF